MLEEWAAQKTGVAWRDPERVRGRTAIQAASIFARMVTAERDRGEVVNLTLENVGCPRAPVAQPPAPAAEALGVDYLEADAVALAVIDLLGQLRRRCRPVRCFSSS